MLVVERGIEWEGRNGFVLDDWLAAKARQSRAAQRSAAKGSCVARDMDGKTGHEWLM